MNKVDWQLFIYGSEKRIEKLDRISKKIFWEEDVALEATEHVLRKWQESGWKRLSRFREGSEEAYLVTVFRNALRDYHRQLYGRCQPPDWIITLGGFPLKVYKALCCEARREDFIVNTMVEEPNRPNLVTGLISEIKRREPRCGKHIRSAALNSAVSLDDEESNIEELTSTSLEQQLELEHIRHFAEVLHLITGAELNYSQSLVEGNYRKVQNLLAELPEFNDQEIVVMKLYYMEDFPATEIAEKLSLKYHQVTHLIKSIRKKLSPLLTELFSDK